MQRDPVKSSYLRAVGYDASSKTLEVEFTDGAIYRYYHVGIATVKNLKSADSLGKFFGKYIRDNYPHRVFKG